MPEIKKASLIFVSLLGLHCSSSTKKIELSEFSGKSVALVEMKGTPTAQRITEVALINQLVHHGSFKLIPKKRIEQLKSQYDTDSTQLVSIAKKANADYALWIDIQQFKAEDEKTKVFKKTIDEDLLAETGSGVTEKVVPLITREGVYSASVRFMNLQTEKTSTGEVFSEKKEIHEEIKSAIHLTPKLRFLEMLAEDAFQKFFKEHL
ncbi:MAG: hypothetical protein CL678_02585 [Bdellovibrionaceae bacterium]|nr:hypothetical protein [Pseudobdellovibrionaceae bacterium]|tara:strand:- start:4639 stop:5259 length:621 start_codon:yes stop_codon:yes gene_type:complete